MNKLNYKYEILTPFKICVLENFPFLEADFDALTNYQIMCKLAEYINKVAQNQNLLQENIKELNNWFNNLDVQDEIDNKLDEMAQDGSLQKIIEEYLNLGVIFHYDNISQMKNAINLKDGSYAQTAGFYDLNDNGGATYHIRNKNVEELENGITTFEITGTNLIAELIKNETINIAILGAKPEENFDNTCYLYKYYFLKNKDI